MTPEQKLADGEAGTARPLFDLAEKIFEIELQDDEVVLGHRLRRPTKQELVDHENQTKVESRQIGQTDEGEQLVTTSQSSERANAALWDKIATDVRHYDFEDGVAPTEWRPLEDHMRPMIPSTHKDTAILGMYAGVAKVERETGRTAFKVAGSARVRVRQEIGAGEEPDFVVTHILRHPTEAEWSRYRARAVTRLNVQGSKEPRTIVRTNLTAAGELYDALLARIEGASVGGAGWTDESRESFISLVDPKIKQLIVTVFAQSWEVDLRD